MRVIIIICSIVMANAAPATDDNCTSGVIFNGQYYDKEVLIENFETLGQFSVDTTNNILLHSYSDFNIIKAGYLNLDTKESGEIKEVKGGFATAFDEANNVAYIGGEHGIFTFNPSSKAAEFYGAKDVEIWSLFIWGKLFYADFPKNNIYDYNSGNPEIVHAFDGNFVKYAIADEEGVFFINGSGLYHTNKAFEVTDVYSTDNAYRFIFKDKSGNIFVGREVTESATEIRVEIYKINKKEKNIERVALIKESVTGMVFDKYDNIIYNESDKAIKLIPNRNKVTCVK